MSNNKLIGAAVIGQSGGPSSVINASAYGVIKTALEADCITAVYGANHGIVGILNDRLMDMSKEDPAELELLLHTPSSALGSCHLCLVFTAPATPSSGTQVRSALPRSSGQLRVLADFPPTPTQEEKSIA